MGSTGDVPLSDQRGPGRAPPALALRRRLAVAIVAGTTLVAGCSNDAPAPATTPAVTDGGSPDEQRPDESLGLGDGTPPADAAEEPEVHTRDPQDSDDAVDDPEDDLTPPELSPPDSVLTEDAFDGPDLTLDAVDLTDGGSGPAVELQVRGTGFPGWQAQYVDPAGTPAAGAGTQAVLAVELVGVAPGAAVGDPPSPAGPVTALVLDESAGGRLTLYLGLSQEPAPFRVHLQHTPLRLVVEVANQT